MAKLESYQELQIPREGKESASLMQEIREQLKDLDDKEYRVIDIVFRPASVLIRYTET